jgi:hypothetical protein
MKRVRVQKSMRKFRRTCHGDHLSHRNTIQNIASELRKVFHIRIDATSSRVLYNVHFQASNPPSVTVPNLATRLQHLTFYLGGYSK